MNVIITNVGRRGYLVDYLKSVKEFDGKVYVSDCDKTASGLYGNNDGHFVLPRPVDDEKKYVLELKNLCLKLGVTLIIPVIDPEIDILSRNKDFFAKDNITVLVSDSRVLEICYNKLSMNTFLEEYGFLFPKTFTNIELFRNAYENDNISFPVMVKPIYGSGSVETFVVETYDNLEARFRDGLMIQELIHGEEYGIDTLNTFEKIPVRCVIKKKVSMRSGETDKAITVKDKQILDCILRLAKELGHIGNLDCDILKDGDKIYVIDLNPRFGGGYPATHATGVNYVETILSMVNGKHIEPEFNNYQENLLVMKEIAIRTIVLEM